MVLLWRARAAFVSLVCVAAEIISISAFVVGSKFSKFGTRDGAIHNKLIAPRRLVALNVDKVSADFFTGAISAQPPSRVDNEKKATTATIATSNSRSEGESKVINRRNVFSRVFSATSIFALSSPPLSAHATYSAYAHREQDWASRIDSGEVKFSTASSLKSQLREIAPMNANSELFCPNGPTSNVTPMMENKCGDRLAAPSVFGRFEDVVGNSIPGRQNVGGSEVTPADVGGFLDYNNNARVKSNKKY